MKASSQLRRRPRALVAALCLLLVPLLAGCWDQLPFPDRAEALVLTADPAKGGAWNFAFYFPNPAVTVSGLTQISSSNQMFVENVDAPTLAEAYLKVEQRLSRHLYIGEIQDLVWPATAPLSALRTLVEAYNREGLTPKTAYVAASVAPARSFVKPTPQEVIPDIYLTRVFGCNGCQPLLLTQQEWQFWDSLDSPGVSPVAPTMTTPERVDELTVYPPRGKPFTYSPPETMGWAILVGKAQHADIGFTVPEGRVGITRISGHVANHYEWQGGRLVVNADIRLKGILAEWPVRAPIDPARLAQVEEVASRKVLEQCLEAIQKAQRAGADPFGYVRDYLNDHPELQSTRTVSQWDETPYVVHVSVSTVLSEVGLNS